MSPAFSRIRLLSSARATKVRLLAPVVWLTPVIVAAAPTQNWRPTIEQIARLESRLVLPDGASGPLQSYSRYYAGVVQNGHREIVGELVYAENKKRQAAIKIVPERRFPADMFDAGCGVIWVTFDPQVDAFSSVVCQPEMKLPDTSAGDR